MDKKVKKSDNPLQGIIEIPSDKSVSHRSIIITSLIKNGRFKVFNFSKGKDCISSLNVFKSLGSDISYLDSTTLEIKTPTKLSASLEFLNCENSGTTMRLSSGILVGQSFNTTLIGDKSLSKRPMTRIIDPLRLMGADISATDNNAPLIIKGNTNLIGINYVSSLASAQVKSCVLLAGLNAANSTSYIESSLSRNHTENLLKYLEADISIEKLNNGYKTTVKKSELIPKDIYVCGDISSAAFFIIAALIIPNSDIIIKNTGLNPTRTGIIDVVKRMGGFIEILNEKEYCGEIIGDIRIKYSKLHACTIEKDDIPKLIDELPAIAVLATQAEGTTIIKNAQDLRNKETDRIKATVSELKKLKADIEETADGFIINGKTELIGDVELYSHHDHRLAMSFYIAGLTCKKEILIKDFEWVNISFPEFEQIISTLT